MMRDAADTSLVLTANVFGEKLGNMNIKMPVAMINCRLLKLPCSQTRSHCTTSTSIIIIHVIIMRQNLKVVNNDFQALYGDRMPVQLIGPNSSMSNWIVQTACEGNASTARQIKDGFKSSTGDRWTHLLLFLAIWQKVRPPARILCVNAPLCNNNNVAYLLQRF